MTSISRVRQKRLSSQGGVNKAEKNLNWTGDQGMLLCVVSFGKGSLKDTIPYSDAGSG